MIYKNRT